MRKQSYSYSEEEVEEIISQIEQNRLELNELSSALKVSYFKLYGLVLTSLITLMVAGVAIFFSSSRFWSDLYEYKNVITGGVSVFSLFILFEVFSSIWATIEIIIQGGRVRLKQNLAIHAAERDLKLIK